MADKFTFLKARINDIVSGEFVENGNDSFLKTKDGREFFRIRIMGTVVEKFAAKDNNYAFLTLDDGSETIRAKFFQQTVAQVNSCQVGDVLDIFGFVRQYEGEVYLAPMISKKVSDPNLEVLRKLELNGGSSSALSGFAGGADVQILAKIAEMDKGSGVKITKLVESLKMEGAAAMEVITDLMMKGELYEPKKGIIKRID